MTTIGHFTLPNDPNQLSWSYTLNVSSQDTLGGRVVQLLSVKLDTVTFDAEAGSLQGLLQLFENMDQLMQYHVDSHLPVKMIVPTKGWTLEVYVTGLPSFAWDITTVTYPYQLSLEVEEDLSGAVTTAVLQTELNNLATGIGYNSQYQGGQQDYTTDLSPDVSGIQPFAPTVPVPKAPVRVF